MNNFFIEPKWLREIVNTKFYYPAAGADFREPLQIFCDHLSEFMFCDTNYGRSLRLEPVLSREDQFELIDQIRIGSFQINMEYRSDPYGRQYRHLAPSKIIERYRRVDGRTIVVIRRCGFGQIGLLSEFEPRSLGVFMHRGDSMGEGGSNCWYLANRKRYYEPCSNLFIKLREKLADKAIIISDGSNTRIKTLCRYHQTPISSIDAYTKEQGKIFDWGGFRWSCIGWMTRRYGPTLVWGVERITH